MKLWLHVLVPVLVMALLLLVVTGCRNTNSATPAHDSKHYSCKEKGFGLDYPATWEVQEIPTSHELLTAIRSPQDGEEDAFVENLTITRDVLPQPMTVDEFYRRSMDKVTRHVPGLKVESEQPFTGKMSGKVIVYTCKVRDANIRACSYFFVHESQGYVLAGLALADTYDKHRPTFDSMAATFTLE